MRESGRAEAALQTALELIAVGRALDDQAEHGVACGEGSGLGGGMRHQTRASPALAHGRAGAGAAEPAAAARVLRRIVAKLCAPGRAATRPGALWPSTSVGSHGAGGISGFIGCVVRIQSRSRAISRLGVGETNCSNKRSSTRQGNGRGRRTRDAVARTVALLPSRDSSAERFAFGAASSPDPLRINVRQDF